MKTLAIAEALLAGFFLVAGSANAQVAPQPVTIALTNYAFAPATIEMKAGVSYRLHLSNDATKAHSFSAPKFFADATVAPEDAAKLAGGNVELDPGKAVDIIVTPKQAGSYDFSCTHFMHAMMGMKGQITVQ